MMAGGIVVMWTETAKVMQTLEWTGEIQIEGIDDTRHGSATEHNNLEEMGCPLAKKRTDETGDWRLAAAGSVLLYWTQNYERDKTIRNSKSFGR